MKVLASLIVVMALVIGIVPQFANCEARGSSMPGARATTAAGTFSGASRSSALAQAATQPTTTMKCLWTARAEIAVAVPLLALGVLMLLSRRKEARRALAVPGALLGVISILLPEVLIGVCASSTAICRTAMLPTMLIAGGLTVTLSLAYLAINEIGPDDPAVASAVS